MNAKIKNAELSRELARQQSFQKDPDALADAAAPRIPGILADGRILAVDAKENLRYEIDQWLVEYPGDAVQPFHRKKGELNWNELGGLIRMNPVIGDREWPLELDIPVALLKEELTPETPTEYELKYSLYADGGNEGQSDITTFAIDLTPPYKVKSPASDPKPTSATFPADLPPGTIIDEEYIASHQAGVLMKFNASYGNYQSTDVLEVFWGIASDPGYATEKWKGPMPASGEVTLPISIFEDSTEGVNTLTYRVTDLPGNVSKTSNANSREVQFLADPVTKPPIVTGADGTGGDWLIDLADCFAGVKIIIDRPVITLDSDFIKPTWGGIDLTEERMGTGATIEFDVDYLTHIKAAYGNTEGEVETKVSYVVLRGAKKIGENETLINVDISYPGPVNPGEPDPVNTDFNLARLESSLGNEDELQDGDFGKPAQVFVKLWAPPPETEEGQLIDVFYEGEKFDTKLLGAAEGEIEKEFELPWDIIAKYNNGTKNIHWRLYTIDGNNPVYSRPTPITVDAVRIILPDPVVQRLNPLGNIICSTLGFPGGTQKVPVVIPKSDYLKDGLTLTLIWEGCTNPDGTGPIPDTRIELPHLISGTVPDEGISLEIGDYLTHIKPAHGAYGKVTYTIPVDAATPESPAAVHGVRLLNNNGDYCEDA